MNFKNQKIMMGLIVLILIGSALLITSWVVKKPYISKEVESAEVLKKTVDETTRDMPEKNQKDQNDNNIRDVNKSETSFAHEARRDETTEEEVILLRSDATEEEPEEDPKETPEEKVIEDRYDGKKRNNTGIQKEKSISIGERMTKAVSPSVKDDHYETEPDYL